MAAAEEPSSAFSADLARSGIKVATAGRCGVRAVTEMEAGRLGFPSPRAGTYFPYLDPLTGNPFAERGRAYGRLRRLDRRPRGFRSTELPRYAQPQGTRPWAYFPALLDWASALDDPYAELWVTEGEKKAIALAQLGVFAIGLGGVWSWRSRPRQLPLLPELAAVNWQGRLVRLAFDHPDVRTNPSVRRARHELAVALERRGARCVDATPPPVEGLDHVGIDDYLVAAAEGRA